MTKRKLLLWLAAICAVLAVAGAVYIFAQGGEASGAFAFIPAVAAFVLYLNARDDGKKDEKSDKGAGGKRR